MNGELVEILLVVRVDDMLVVCAWENCQVLTGDYAVMFSVKHLGGLTWYAGCALERKEGTLEIYQISYVQYVVDNLGFTETGPSPPNVFQPVPGSEEEHERNQPRTPRISQQQAHRCASSSSQSLLQKVLC